MKQKVRHKAFLVALAYLVAAMLMLALGVGCLGGGGSLTNLPEKEATTLSLHIRLGKVDATAPAGSGVLGKSAVELDEDGQIILKNMKLRFTSNLKDTVWSDVTMDQPADAGPSGGNSERSVFINVALAPLRWWNLEIKTYDQHDSVIHYAVVNAISSKGGQAVNVTVPLINSRFSLYEARYVLPAAIYASSLDSTQRVYQKIFFSRLVLSVDSQVVRDSTSFSSAITSAGTRFISAGDALRGSSGSALFFRPNAAAPDTITHVQTYQYVETGLRKFQISAYGYLEGDSVGAPLRLLFQGSATMNITPGAVVQETPVVLDWKGPGSTPNDTTLRPGDLNWTGVGMQVTVGKTGKVTQQIEIPGGLDL